MDSYTTADMSDGAIYRALPVYRVTSPERPVTPELLPKLNTTAIRQSNGIVVTSRRPPTRRIIRASIAH